MAIIIEEEKKPINWVALLATAVIVVILFVGSYFLFFKKPELIEIVGPRSLQDLGKLSQLTFQPETVLNSPSFKLLRQYATDIPLLAPGKSNPFRP